MEINSLKNKVFDRFLVVVDPKAGSSAYGFFIVCYKVGTSLRFYSMKQTFDDALLAAHNFYKDRRIDVYVMSVSLDSHMVCKIECGLPF